MKLKILPVLFFICTISLSAEEKIENLIAGYFKNNLDLLTLSADMDNAILNNKSAEISNGFSIQLASGSIEISRNEKDKTEISFAPSTSITFPQANNLTASVSSSIKLLDGSKEKATTKLSLSADLISGNAAKRSITLEESKRSVLVAQRNLQNGFINAETEFYENLKKLYKIGMNITSAQKDLYEDNLDFEKIQTQGYSTGSTKYRLAKMEVLSSQRKVDLYQHELERETRIFAGKCGYSVSTNAADFLPSVIPQVEALNIKDFPKENFTKTENAVWNAYINQKKRDADYDFTLSANAGYTFDNEIHDDKFKNTVDLGTSLTWLKTGLTANAGVSIPTDNSNPKYIFGLTIIPNQFRLNKISKEQEAVAANKEKIQITSSKTDYVTTVISQRTTLSDLKWNKEKNKEIFDMYDTLEKDSAVNLEKGYITESEYNSVKANKENYRIQCLIDDIEFILYNNTTKLYFTRDEELKHE